MHIISVFPFTDWVQGRLLRHDLENWESDFCNDPRHRYLSIIQAVFSSAPWSKQRQLWGQLGLLRPLSSSVLKNSKDGDHMTSLGNVFHCWTVLMGKRFVSPLFKLMPIVSCPLPCTAPSSSWPLCIGSGGGYWPVNSPSKAVSYRGWRSPGPSPSPYWVSASDPTMPVALCWTCSSLSMFFSGAGGWATTEHGI